MDSLPFTNVCGDFGRKVNGTRLFESFLAVGKQRRRRLRTRHLNSEFARAASNFIALILSRFIRQMLANFLELNSKGLH